ncbi:MAG: NADH-quinone oxidoreductase subunit J [Nitrospirae bacterium]|nr:NADH-quinone oxidoreductase subunit J [Nitrospirota bacterium]
MAHLFFFYFAGVIVLTSILVVALRNPIYSALSLLIMFFHVAGLYVTLHAEFLAAVQIIVYAGAILVLYLFVVMLLNLKREERYHAQFPIGALLGLTIVTEVLLLAFHGSSPPEPAPSGTSTPATNGVTEVAGVTDAVAGPALSAVEGNTETIGESLYTTYLFPFEVASLILLVAMIGSIVLAKKDIFEQQ